MEMPILVLLVIISVILSVLLLSGIIYGFYKFLSYISYKRSCYPFKNGGFTEDNGYEDWRRK